MLQRLVDWAFDRVDIGADNPAGPLMSRWRIMSTRAFGVKVHHIRRADADRWLHDHPWSFVSIRVKGTYTEMLAQRGPCGFRSTRFARNRRISRIRYDTLHQVTRTPPAGVWTIVVNGPRRHPWGIQDVTGPYRSTADTFEALAHDQGARRSNAKAAA